MEMVIALGRTNSLKTKDTEPGHAADGDIKQVIALGKHVKHRNAEE
ncbi:MAG: hypothetical protein KAT86_00800 [Candidatus Latescibacteria bacterium]|nr:hypothetical protein [Candidatus Latescibacterota bacterium]